MNDTIQQIPLEQIRPSKGNRRGSCYRIGWRDVAWYFEGEGSVGYYRTASASRHYLFVRLTSTNRALLSEMRQQLHPAGSITCTTRAGSTTGGVTHRKTGYALTFTGEKALLVLHSLIDHLPAYSEKLPQVRLALRLGKWAGSQSAARMKQMKHDTLVAFDEEQPELLLEEQV